MPPKSIKNRSKSSFRGLLFPHRFLYRFLIVFYSQLRPPGSQKSMFFFRKIGFFFNRLSKITSISASILVPTCLHVGLQNRRFSEIMVFQEAFKISSFLGIDFLSILGPSWPPTWGHLGGQDGLKFEKMGLETFYGAMLCWILIRLDGGLCKCSLRPTRTRSRRAMACTALDLNTTLLLIIV